MKLVLKAFAVTAMLALSACTNSSVMDEIDRQEVFSAQQKADLLAASNAYLEQNKQKMGVVVTQSGLQYQMIRPGDQTLPKPGPTDTVMVHYEGTLPDGKVFDSSYARDEPAVFQVNGVIKGWQEMLQLMHPGDAVRVVVPPAIAYGELGQDDIPPNQVLIFKVELLKFQDSRGRTIAPAAQ